MYRTVLVPLDGSKFAEHALPLALSIAGRAGATLQLAQAHVCLASTYADVPITFENIPDNVAKQRECGYLDRIVKRLNGVSPIPVEAALLDGPIAEAVREQATLTGADLVVMTTHGRGPLGRFLLGSVADELVRQLPIPVLLVRPHEAEVNLTQQLTFRHILVPLDGSRLAEQIIEPAVALGTLTDADYTLLRVIKPMAIGPREPAEMPAGELDRSAVPQLTPLYEDDQAQAGNYLERIADGLRARSLRVQTRVSVHNHPHVAILDEVRAHRADLLAIATHGRGQPLRLLLGSVADKVVRGSAVPVLLQCPATA